MKTVRDQVYATLIADASYLVLVGSPSAAPYQTFYARKPSPPAYPYVVFHLRPSVNNQAYPRHLLSSRTELVFDAWDAIGPQPPEHEEIVRRIIQLMHQRANANGFRPVLAIEPAEMFDEEIGAVGATVSFEVFYRRFT